MPLVRLDRDSLLHVLAWSMLDAVDERRFSTDILLIEPLLWWDLMVVLYRRIRIKEGEKLLLLDVSFRSNPRLAGLVRELRILTCPPFAEFQDVDIFGSSFAIPSILAAVAPTVQHLELTCRLHPDILFVFRTTYFPRLESMEVPYYFVLDALSTIRLHARIRNFLSEVHVFRREGPRIQRLTLVTVIDGWPVLKRLCVRCKWGLPPFDGPIYDLTYLKTIVDLSVLLVDRSWEANVAFFLAHVRPPPNVEVIALLLCNGQFVRHSLFTEHRFHPKLVVPVFGDPLQAVYRGDQILPYIDNLLCVVSEPPRYEEFWRKIREFVDRRTLLPDLFLSDGRDLLRLK